MTSSHEQSTIERFIERIGHKSYIYMNHNLEQIQMKSFFSKKKKLFYLFVDIIKFIIKFIMISIAIKT